MNEGDCRVEITVTIPDELAVRLRPVEQELPRILRIFVPKSVIFAATPFIASWVSNVRCGMHEVSHFSCCFHVLAAHTPRITNPGRDSRDAESSERSVPSSKRHALRSEVLPAKPQAARRTFPGAADAPDPRETPQINSATGSRSSRMYIGRPLPLGKVCAGSMPSAW